MFCKHKWVMISETTIESPIHRMAKIGVVKFENLPSDIAYETFIQVIQCEKCGKLKRYVEKV